MLLHLTTTNRGGLPTDAVPRCDITLGYQNNQPHIYEQGFVTQPTPFISSPFSVWKCSNEHELNKIFYIYYQLE